MPGFDIDLGDDPVTESRRANLVKAAARRPVVKKEFDDYQRDYADFLDSLDRFAEAAAVRQEEIDREAANPDRDVIAVVAAMDDESAKLIAEADRVRDRMAEFDARRCRINEEMGEVNAAEAELKAMG